MIALIWAFLMQYVFGFILWAIIAYTIERQN